MSSNNNIIYFNSLLCLLKDYHHYNKNDLDNEISKLFYEVLNHDVIKSIDMDDYYKTVLFDSYKSNLNIVINNTDYSQLSKSSKNIFTAFWTIIRLINLESLTFNTSKTLSVEPNKVFKEEYIIYDNLITALLCNDYQKSAVNLTINKSNLRLTYTKKINNNLPIILSAENLMFLHKLFKLFIFVQLNYDLKNIDENSQFNFYNPTVDYTKYVSSFEDIKISSNDEKEVVIEVKNAFDFINESKSTPSSTRISLDSISIKTEILNYLKEDNTLTASKIAEYLNVSSRTVERNIKLLKEEKKIRRVGSKKKGKFLLTEEDND